MAIMIPEAISVFDTEGEGRVYNYLKDNLPSDYIVFYNLRSQITGLIDFIIVCPTGILGIEVKDWSSPYIKSCDAENVSLNDASHPVEIHPVKTAQHRIHQLVKNQIKKKIIALAKKTIRYSGVAWYVNLNDSELNQKISRGKTRNNGTIHQLTSDDFSSGAEELIKSCFESIEWYSTRNLTFDECEVIKDFILEEKKIHVTFDDLVIELDKRQMEYAKHMGYGQYILRGAAGTGKTVRLVGRAICLAERHADYTILFVTSKKPLAKLVFPNFQAYSNISLYSREALLQDLTILSKFNVILIDELQDFSKEEIKLIKSLLYNPDKSHFIGAIDGAQNTFNNQYNLLDIADKIELLTQNYRNGDNVLSYVKSVGQSESHNDTNNSSYYGYYDQTISPHTNVGEVHRIDLRMYQRTIVNAQISNNILSIIRQYTHLLYKEIAIVNIGSNTVLQSVSKAMSHSGIPSELGFSANNSIKLLNNNSTKGLEFKLVVLLLNCQLPKPKCEQSKILASSRATEYLYVIGY